ncbi:LysM peptidoglycan-binding domain-containing protein [Nocardioides bruguierae]|uniref:LysM peptidoglycan-binding domain-containing protein n=1 Tax=Nocardioides bruguierae TaxID=2945102 RepID=A0A9X2IDT2_9ACTN|nr:LysM domain-containing protein [Nocardioides bruguierae]MCL8024955.1 LysM peptidoglycan-binding domain-containing protein [Nocardioides bruguierae]MCM0619358.1 LysM peptidoglycan-binding domain-containing protein [Nocardioides bruguierae]
MTSSTRASLPRCLAVQVGATALVGALVAALRPGLVASTLVDLADPSALAAQPGAFSDVLVAGCTAALLVCLAWAWLATTAVTLQAARGAAAARVPGVPSALRGLVLRCLGVGLVGVVGATGLAGTAHATPTQAGTVQAGLHASGAQTSATTGSATVITGVAGLSGLPLPQRAGLGDRTRSGDPAAARAATHASPAPRARPAPSGTHLVRTGDCLWDIAEAHLRRGGDAHDDVAVAAYVARLHAANRAEIGADPDLVLPGQVLVLPV